MNYYLITGASRGLGEAIIKELLRENHVIFYLSRTSNKTLEALAVQNHVPLYFYECNLTNIEQIKKVINKVVTKIDLVKAKRITLINNAGMIEPIKHIGDATEEDIIANIQINLLAPILLSECLIKKTKGFGGETVIVNITSGAAKRPTAGWSTYCSTKAGLNMFTQTLAEEQGDHRFPVKTLAFSPGIMDTDMQKTIRKAGKEDFALIDQFKDYYEKGMLRKTDFVAGTLVKLLDGPFENGRIYDIKEFI